ncbi:hypothetical protein [Nocardioides pyridinolyticus]
MTEQQTLDQPTPPPPPAAPVEQPRPRRTVGLRVLVASTVGAFVIGTLVGGGFGALIGYVAHPDGPGGRPANFQPQDPPQRPGFGAEQLPQEQSSS